MISKGHDGFGQVAEVSFHRARDRFSLPLATITQHQLFILATIQALLNELGHSGADAYEPVKPLFLQTSRLQLSNALLDKIVPYIVQNSFF